MVERGPVVLMQVRRRSHKLLATVAFIALVVPLMAGFVAPASAQEAAPQPTIASDVADYQTGANVVLTGSNWQPGEFVNTVVHDDGVGERDWQRDITITADENGDIRNEFQLPEWFVANYSVKATSAQSGVATASFTDAVAGIEGKDKGETNYRSTGGPWMAVTNWRWSPCGSCSRTRAPIRSLSASVPAAPPGAAYLPSGTSWTGRRQTPGSPP